MSEGPTPQEADSDIYTVLIAVAALFVLVGTIYTSVRADALFGTWMPF